MGIFTLGYAQSAALSDMVKNHRVPFCSPKFNQHSIIQPHAKFFLQSKAAHYHTSNSLKAKIAPLKALLLPSPFNSQDLNSNSPYCMPYSSCDVSLENLVLDQLITLNWSLIVLILITIVCLILYWYCKEKFCLGHSWELMGLTHESDTQYYMPKLEICSLLIVILWGIKFDHPIILLYLFVIALTLIQDCYWGLSSLGSWLKAKLSL